MGQNGGDALMWNEEYTSINPQVLNQPVQKDIMCFNTYYTYTYWYVTVLLLPMYIP